MHRYIIIRLSADTDLWICDTCLAMFTIGPSGFRLHAAGDEAIRHEAVDRWPGRWAEVVR